MLEKWKQKGIGFYKNEDGIGTLELLLILAVIVVIAIAFRKWIFQWVNNLFTKADTDIKDQTNNSGINVPPTTSP